jgi:AcrR family transcriptional regulator
MPNELSISVNDQDDGDERRKRILDHAVRAFFAHGYDGANIEDIAIAAGVSKVTIYRYFNDKAGLVTAVLNKAAADLVTACRITIDVTKPIEDTLTDFAIRYLTRMIHTVGERPFYEVSRLLLEVSYGYHGVARAWYTVIFDEIAGPLTKLIQAYIDSGVIIKDGDAEFLGIHFLQSLIHAGAAIVAPPGNPAVAPADNEIAAFSAKKVKLFLRGCLASPQR